MKTLLFFLFSILVSTSQSETSSKKHFIFFVHGIGGSAQTFGSFPEALAGHLNKAKPDTSHEALTFVYPTSNQTLTPNEFAVLLGEFIDQTVVKSGIQKGDKISLISHSQGGLVSLIWYFQAYLQNQKKLKTAVGMIPNHLRDNNDFHSEHLDKIDAIISIGTPYWGSKLASFLTADGWFAELLSEKFFSKLGHRQLEEMSLKSETINRFRMNATSIPPALLSEMSKKIRPLNIAGVADVVEMFREKTHGASNALKLFKNFTFGSRYWESDVAVPLPAARFDSLYTIDKNESYVPGQVTPVATVKETHFSPLLIINALHASPYPDSVPDMVEVSKDCVVDLECNHPSFKFVYQHMLGQPLPAHGPGVQTEYLGGFMISFKVNFPLGRVVPPDDVKIRLMNPNASSDFKITMATSQEIISNVSYELKTFPNSYFQTELGHFEFVNYLSDGSKSAKLSGQKALFLIQAKGFRPRYVETILKPTYSTFVEINLVPN